MAVSPHLSQLTRVLERATKHIISFGFLFFIVFFGFTKAFYIAFSVYIEGFSTMSSCAFSLFRAVLGDFDFHALKSQNWFLGPLLFTLFVFFVVFVLLNMFLAILNDACMPDVFSLTCACMAHSMLQTLKHKKKLNPVKTLSRRHSEIIGKVPALLHESVLAVNVLRG